MRRTAAHAHLYTAAQAVRRREHQVDLVTGLVGHAGIYRSDFHRRTWRSRLIRAAKDVQLRLQLLLNLHLDGVRPLDGGGLRGLLHGLDRRIADAHHALCVRQDRVHDAGQQAQR